MKPMAVTVGTAVVALSVAASCGGSVGAGAGYGDSGAGSSSSDGASGSESSSGSGGGSNSSASSGSSSGTGSGSGAGSGSTSGSSMASSSGSSSGGDGGTAVNPYDGGPQACGLQAGAQQCDLKTQTCCVDRFLNGTCVPHGQSCPQATFGFSCLGAIDCASPGDVCCGVGSVAAMQANTACQTVAPGQACQPSMQTSTTGSAQLCVTAAECTMGQQCIYQGCTPIHADLWLCGLQSGSPGSCTAQ